MYFHIKFLENTSIIPCKPLKKDTRSFGADIVLSASCRPILTHTYVSQRMLITTLCRRDAPADSEEELRSFFVFFFGFLGSGDSEGCFFFDFFASGDSEDTRCVLARRAEPEAASSPNFIELATVRAGLSARDSSASCASTPSARACSSRASFNFRAANLALCQLLSSFCAPADIFDQNCQVKQFSLRKRCWSNAAAWRATLAPQSGHCCR